VGLNLTNYNIIKKALTSSCQFMAVTKSRPLEDILELINFDHDLFGENRVQEAEKKFKTFRDTYKFELHLIGPLQSNKVELALSTFDCIQSLDRKKIVDAIVKFKNKNSEKIKTKKFFIQINIGDENQKSGVSIKNLKNFYNYCLESQLSIAGLMCIPPNNENPIKYFQQMNEIKNLINGNLKLSMGMSEDYKLAIQHGSNMIRVGSLLFET